MTIATKNGSVIIKSGSVAQNCGCCGGGDCQDLGLIWPDLIEMPVRYEFSCSGVAGFPAVEASETVTAGTWDTIPLPGQASQWGRIITGDYQNRQYTLRMYLYYNHRYSWGAQFDLTYYEYPSGSGANYATHQQSGIFNYQCNAGTTMVEPLRVFTTGSGFYYDYIEPGSTPEGQGGCCCAQYGPGTIFPSGGRVGVCTDGLSISPSCDSEYNDSGNLTGVCKKRSAPFGNTFEFSRYHSQHPGRFVYFTVTLPDWRMYRTNPLP